MNGWRPSLTVDLARKWHSSPGGWQTPLIKIRGARSCNFECMVVTFLFLHVAVSGSAGRLNETARVGLSCHHRDRRELRRLCCESCLTSKATTTGSGALAGIITSSATCPDGDPSHSAPVCSMTAATSTIGLPRRQSSPLLVRMQVPFLGFPTFPFVAGMRDAITASSLAGAPITSGTVSSSGVETTASTGAALIERFQGGQSS